MVMVMVVRDACLDFDSRGRIKQIKRCLYAYAFEILSIGHRPRVAQGTRIQDARRSLYRSMSCRGALKSMTCGLERLEWFETWSIALV